MSYDDCAVIAKCLETAGEVLFEEVGYIGGGDNADVMTMVTRTATASRSASPPVPLTSPGCSTQTPQAYDEYLSAQRGRI